MEITQSDHRSFSTLPVLVTGGAGFIGSHMVDELVQRGSKVVIIDRSIDPGYTEVRPNVIRTPLDLNDTEQVAKILLKYKPQVIYHFAGHTRLREALQNPLEDMADNLRSTVSLIEACLRAKEKKAYQPEQIIFSSSVRVNP